MNLAGISMGLLVIALAATALAEPDRQRVVSEACSLIGQQRNALADALAVAEAQRKLTQERLDEWGVYFKAYVGVKADG